MLFLKDFYLTSSTLNKRLRYYGAAKCVTGKSPTKFSDITTFPKYLPRNLQL